MRYSKTLLTIAVCSIFSTVSFAQTYKLDEFKRVDEGELKDRVNWIFTFLNHSEPVTAYVIVYGAVDRRFADVEQTELLVRIRGSIARSPHHEARITTIFGGYRRDETAEVYIVPKYGASPEPTWTIGDSGGKKDALLWSTRRFREEDDELDEFVNRALLYRLAEADKFDADESEPVIENTEYNDPAYTVPNDSYPITPSNTPEPETLTETVSEPEIKSPSIGVVSQIIETEPTPDVTEEEREDIRFSWIASDFADDVKRQDGASGVMIFYADDQFYDISRLHAFIEQGRDRITGKAELDVCQIEVIFGGYRGRAQIEYYIVPEGGKMPEATPEER